MASDEEGTRRDHIEHSPAGLADSVQECGGLRRLRLNANGYAHGFPSSGTSTRSGFRSLERLCAEVQLGGPMPLSPSLVNPMDGRVPLAVAQELAIDWHGDDKGNPQ